jgi:hypothetical protein
MATRPTKTNGKKRKELEMQGDTTIEQKGAHQDDQDWVEALCVIREPMA